MKKAILAIIIFLGCFLLSSAQEQLLFRVPVMPDTLARKATLQSDWAALQASPPRLMVRDCFLFLLDALDADFLAPAQVEWVLKLVQTRMVHDPTAGRSYGNIFWGWNETGNDVGDGNNVEFCLQYGLPIKLLFDDKLSTNARQLLDEIFALGIKGARNQEVRISYTNIYLMKIWNFIAYGQVYQQPEITAEGRGYFNEWLNHFAQFGNREYDSPTYYGVDLESLLLMYRFCNDADIKAKARDVLNFFLTDICAHYNARAGILTGAHSRDYNRVFSRDLLEEKYFNPLLGWNNNNTHLFHQLNTETLQQIGLTPFQKTLMNRADRFIVQRWDSLPHTFATNYAGSKFSIASSNQAYSPDDKPFVIYLSSEKIPAMPNIAYVMEGRDDHYGTWAAEGKGPKLKQLMPAGYPSNGGWNKTRHLMPFMQAAQNKGEVVMLLAGEKDHNCIYEHLNSTIVLPAYFDEIWMGDKRVKLPAVGKAVAMDNTKTFFAKFEDVAIAIKILWDDAGAENKASLINDGFAYQSQRENFTLLHNKALRLTLKHANNGKAAIAMWWKVEGGIRTTADFKRFRSEVLKAPVSANFKDGIVDVSVNSSTGKLGVRADIVHKQRLHYYNPVPLPAQFLLSVDGIELGLPIVGKYKK